VKFFDYSVANLSWLEKYAAGMWHLKTIFSYGALKIRDVTEIKDIPEKIAAPHEPSAVEDDKALFWDDASDAKSNIGGTGITLESQNEQNDHNGQKIEDSISYAGSHSQVTDRGNQAIIADAVSGIDKTWDLSDIPSDMF
jgi:hypothetical protein